MASNVEIANRALQRLGAKIITSLTEDSVNARAVNTAFEPVKRAELRKHPWSFAIKRAQLAASATAPLFTRTNSFPLPADCLRVLSPDPEVNYNDLDWQIEGRNIITNDDAPLDVRYIYDVTDPNEMDVLFREALAARLAVELAEQLTQSNAKKADAAAMYDNSIAEAKRANAIERVAQRPPEDTWVTIRD
ncbi:MAG: hypothetical protein KDA17_00525 [Candidatus Saccharibacteria bacterium]|nr:hypothetical protein [Candidatus Saccharibacteria bacterium]